MMGQEIRNKFTDYWKEHGIKKPDEFAVLTSIIYQEWADISVKDHKSEAELIFTALAEFATRQIAETMLAEGKKENKIAGKSGGAIAKRTRLELENKTGKKAVSADNYLLSKKYQTTEKWGVSVAINKQEIKCPKCGELISIDDVLTRPIEEQIKKKYEIAQKANEQVLANKLDAVNRQVAEIEEKNKNINSIIAEKLNDQLKLEKNKLFKEVRAEAEKEQSLKTAFLEEQLKNKDEKLEQATKNEIELRKEKSRLEEQKRNFELEKMRQLEEEKKGFMEEARIKAEEKYQYDIAKYKKQINDFDKTNKELTRKLEQGSQQTQGEVLELVLEDLLKSTFPHDKVLPVPTGVTGADIIQKVFDRTGRLCGQIAWETKKTKSWNENWIQKLKDDQRAIKADLAVIVSAALPENVKGFIFRDGVWICDIKVIVALATALRINLESITREKALSVGKNEKMEILYGYLTGVEFKQRVEVMLEVFSSMEADLKKERIAYEKIWAKREKQIKKVMINMAGMHGDLSGFVPLPQIKSLELSIEENE